MNRYELARELIELAVGVIGLVLVIDGVVDGNFAQSAYGMTLILWLELQ